MRYIGVLDYQNQPTQRRTEPNDDLRTVIGQLLNLVQNAAVECAKVSAAVWEESGQVGRAPLAKVLTISLDASKVPSLLLRAPDQTTLALPGIGKTGRRTPLRAACPYCDSVAELAEEIGGGLLYRYHCCNAACGYDSSYSPAQLAAWLAKHPIREDGHKLTMPDGDFYRALASYRDGARFAVIIWSDKPYDAGLKSVNQMGDAVSPPFRCRPIKGIERARAVLKTWLAGKLEVECHDAGMDSAEAIPLWADPPAVLTTVEDLRRLFEGEFGWRPSSVKIITTEGKRIEPYRVRMVRDDAIDCQGMALSLDDIARVDGTGNPDDHSTAYPEPVFTLYEKPGWTPPAKPARRAKGKKADEALAEPAAEEAGEPEGATEE